MSSFLMTNGQNDSLNSFKKNIIQINLVSLPPLFNNLNQKWLGLEYQRNISRDFSSTLMTDFGKFQDYTFTKFHDYFDENQGFSYTTEEVRISGYHIIPSAKYIVLRPIQKSHFDIYVSMKFDYYQYFMKKKVFDSYSNKTDRFKISTYRFNIGGGAGVQYIAFSRLTVDLNISIFSKIYSNSSKNNIKELYPQNSFWKSSNNSSWATINLMLGYAFGNKKHKNK